MKNKIVETLLTTGMNDYVGVRDILRQRLTQNKTLSYK